MDSTDHMAVQSKLTSIHLAGFMAKLLAYSMPFIQSLNSGQRNAEPAYAASMCSQISSSWPEGRRLRFGYVFGLIG